MTLSPTARGLLAGLSLVALAGCDPDLRGRNGGLTTARAASRIDAERPLADERGVISYPTYQVAEARRGDTVADIAARVGVSAPELASYNGLSTEVVMRPGELLALPSRVSEPGSGFGGGAAGSIAGSGDQIDITRLAGGAIERADAQGTRVTAPQYPGSSVTTSVPPQGIPGREPVRHQVLRGETAYSIARTYGISPKVLADWNGLGPDLGVREGQFLLIPVPGEAQLTAAAPPVTTSEPGTQSYIPEPPSSARPLPTEEPAAAVPASPDLGRQRSTSAQLAFPAQGSIIRGYQKKKNEGIDIGAPEGSPVKAAGDGTVAAITRDTDQVPIMVLRHADNLLTVYASIDGITVAKGDTVKRGQTIAAVRAGSPSFVHFEVRKGFESVDPLPYLQ